MTISRFLTPLCPSEVQSVVACRTGPKGCLAAAQGFHHGIVQRLKDPDAALTWAKENAPALVAVETVERLDADGFRDTAERLRAEAGELLPGVEYSEGGDAFSLSFPTEVKPKKAKA